MKIAFGQFQTVSNILVCLKVGVCMWKHACNGLYCQVESVRCWHARHSWFEWHPFVKYFISSKLGVYFKRLRIVFQGTIGGKNSCSTSVVLWLPPLPNPMLSIEVECLVSALYLNQRCSREMRYKTHIDESKRLSVIDVRGMELVVQKSFGLTALTLGWRKIHNKTNL